MCGVKLQSMNFLPVTEYVFKELVMANNDFLKKVITLIS